MDLIEEATVDAENEEDSPLKVQENFDLSAKKTAKFFKVPGPPAEDKPEPASQTIEEEVKEVSYGVDYMTPPKCYPSSSTSSDHFIKVREERKHTRLNSSYSSGAMSLK